MPEYRRAFRPGGTFFFTIVTHERRPFFADVANVERLRDAIRAVRAERPFEFDAGVVLPDHMHFIGTLIIRCGLGG
jgi:putative transposase